MSQNKMKANKMTEKFFTKNILKDKIEGAKFRHLVKSLGAPYLKHRSV